MQCRGWDWDPVGAEGIMRERRPGHPSDVKVTRTSIPKKRKEGQGDGTMYPEMRAVTAGC